MLILLASYQKYLTNVVRKENNWEAEFIDIKYSDVSKIANYQNVKDVFTYYDFGLSQENNSSSIVFAQKIYVKAYDNKALNNANIKIIEGRLPENSKELLVTKDNFQDKNVGDQISITLEGTLRTFTIVGMAENLEEDNSDISNNLAGAITYLDQDLISEDMLVSVRILTNNVQKVCKTTRNIADDLKIYEIENKDRESNQDYDSVTSAFIQEFQNLTLQDSVVQTDSLENADNKQEKLIYNEELLKYECVTEIDETFRNMLLIVGGSFVFIIFLLSTVVIYTIFSISYTERINELGTLLSIGMSKSELRKLLLKETLILGIIGIITRNFIRIITLILHNTDRTNNIK